MTYTLVYLEMPKSDLNQYFDGGRPEWTGRKHALAARYFIPAAMKMKSVNGHIALIDGYAGPNMYAGEVKGSTVIMLDAARRVIAKGAKATVFACEPDARRFRSLEENLREAVDSGILTTINSTHGEAVPEIWKKIGRAAALVFLDPQTASEMTLKADIYPWASRRHTDILGVFMGGDACRVCASLLSTNPASETMRASLGDDWKSATSEDAAYEVFTAALGNAKRYRGLYRLRKQEPKRDAYGIFGLSDSAHGMWLLSEAIAKDWGVLRDYDASKRVVDLFTEIDAENESREAFDALIAICRPFVKANPSLRGEALAIETLKKGIVGTFGRYVGADFTRASKVILGGN